jgi:hypothetical protein
MPEIKIVSDGTRIGTAIYDPVTGDQVPWSKHVTRVEIVLDALEGNQVKVEMLFFNAAIDVVASHE